VKRREFLRLVGMAAIAAGAVALLPLPALSRPITFNYSEQFSLWHIHNRIREGQRVFVWRDSGRHNFTTTGTQPKLPGDWAFIGILEWRVGAAGKSFEYWVHS